MPTVQLIVTGKTEEMAIAQSLMRIFDGEVSFFSTCASACPPNECCGITSTQLKAPIPSVAGVQGKIDKFAAELVAAVDPGRKGTPSDMAILIDDLELDNLDQPQIVMDIFVEAVERCIQNRWSDLKRRQRCADIVKTRCSFHFAVPMIEAYFFYDNPNALMHAGTIIPSTISGNLLDMETFQVDEHVHNGISYLKSPGGRKDHDPFWTISPALRPKHPQKYIDFLCCPKTKKNKQNRKKFYKEYRGNDQNCGAKALANLDWNRVFKNSQHAQYLRALIHDIAFYFNIKTPFAGNCAPVTEYKSGQGRILRNC